MISTVSQLETVIGMREMACAPGAQADWIACDNEYATGNRAAIEAGAFDYLDAIAVRLRRR